MHIYLKIDVFLRFFNEPEAQLPLKTDVSCEASANFHRSSQNATPCHGICTLSPLDAALTMRFEKNEQHESTRYVQESKVLRLPRKMTMEVPKVLRMPPKMQRIFWKRRESIAPVTQNDFRHVTKHV